MARLNLKECDGIRLKSFILAGTRWVSFYKEHLDSINYFPVPDADTGANMYLTFTSICNQIRGEENPYSASAVAKAAAMGGLIGGKGNSGLILAQFFRGFAESIGDKEILIAEDIAMAFSKAAKTAREGIIDPKEGTILTVAEDGATFSTETLKKSDEIIDIIKAFYGEAQRSLEKTRNLLPELAEKQVVDAGAKGLVLFFEGMLRMGTGKSIKKPEDNKVKEKNIYSDRVDIKYRFCTSMIIRKYPDVKDKLIKEKITDYGDSLIIDRGIENVSRIHIHTNDPDEVLDKLSEFGIVENVNIDDMKKQVVDR